MAQNKIQMPGAFGGLMRYDEEYKSRIMITATQVIGFVIAILVFVLVLKLFFPTPPPGPPGFIIPLLTSLI